MIWIELFWTFFKIGLFTFGGGYAMIPLIRSEVTAHGWAETEDIINFIAVSESTPGPLAVNMATFIGRTTGGIPGAICATLGVVLPSFIIILLVAGAYAKYKNNKLVNGVMIGLRPAVIGMIAAALITFGIEVISPKEGIGTASAVVSSAIFAVMTFLALKKKNPVMIIILSGTIGVIAGYIMEL